MLESEDFTWDGHNPPLGALRVRTVRFDDTLKNTGPYMSIRHKNMHICSIRFLIKADIFS